MKGFSPVELLIVAVILIGAFLICFTTGSVFFTQKTVACLVDDKERITVGHGESISSKFLVYCENEVFENTDNLFALKFNSADVQRDLKQGKNYNIRVYGWRIPFLSMFRNILYIVK